MEENASENCHDKVENPDEVKEDRSYFPFSEEVRQNDGNCEEREDDHSGDDEVAFVHEVGTHKEKPERIRCVGFQEVCRPSFENAEDEGGKEGSYEEDEGKESSF